MAKGCSIQRTLQCNDGTSVTENDLTRRTGVVVVLAEPGAGKSRLLEVVAKGLATTTQRASIFRNTNPMTPRQVLILDALDEVAKRDPLAIDEILVKAKNTGARSIVLASRSSEWEQSRSVFIKDCFGTEPWIVHLKPLNLTEQRELFLDHVPGEDFTSFRNEVQKFSLESLLGNPQFLKLFAGAYVESNRHFETKTGIFDHAIRRLAQEVNPAVSHGERPSVDKLISCANEVFAKLLLSGAVGISNSEEPDQCEFPYSNALMPEDGDHLRWILDTRLFGPSTKVGQHEPIHRIVAEYCGARYPLQPGR